MRQQNGIHACLISRLPGWRIWNTFLLRVGDQEVWFHQSDSKVPSGAAGHVTYWQVTDFDVVLERAIHLGAKLYRGPLDRQDGNYMCQVMDPDGNLIGLIGPRYEDNGAGASI